MSLLTWKEASIRYAGHCSSTEHCCKAECPAAQRCPVSQPTRELWRSAPLLCRLGSSGHQPAQASFRPECKHLAERHFFSVQAIAAAQSIAARLSAQQPSSAPSASAPGSYGNQPYSYADQTTQGSNLPGPPPNPPNGGAGAPSDAIAAAQAVAARLSAQAGVPAVTAPGAGGYSGHPGQTFTPSAQVPSLQQYESKQEQAIRAAEAVAARFSVQAAAPAANPYGSLYGQSVGMPSGATIQNSSFSPHASSAPSTAHDPVAAARAVAARLAGQSAPSYPGASIAAAGSSVHGGPSAQDPIAAAQAVAARLAARHGDTSVSGPPSNPYGGSNRGSFILHPPMDGACLDVLCLFCYVNKACAK